MKRTRQSGQKKVARARKDDLELDVKYEAARQNLIGYLLGTSNTITNEGCEFWDQFLEQLAAEPELSPSVLSRTLNFLQGQYQEFLDDFTIELFSRLRFEQLESMIFMGWQPSPDFELNARVNIFVTAEDNKDQVTAQQMLNWAARVGVLLSNDLSKLERPESV